MSDLADRLKGVIEEKLAEARKHLRYAQDTILMLSDPKYWGRSVPGWHEWPAIEAMLALSIRQHEAALRVLERHRPMVGDPRWCVTCTRDGGVEAATPCIELVDLAEAYAVPAGEPS